MMFNKYDIEFSKDTIKNEILRLTNQLWKLIPMWENGEDWNKQLMTVIIDIAGKDEIFLHDSHFLQLLSKLEGLRVTDDMKQSLVGKITECDDYVKSLTVPPKPSDISQRACGYCNYSEICKRYM